MFVRYLIVSIPAFRCCIWIAQTAYTVCIVPGLEFRCQSSKHFLLNVIHAAPVNVMRLCILSDGEPIPKPFLKKRIIISQHRFKALLQKNAVFRHSGKFCLRDAYILFSFDTKLVLTAVYQVMLTQILGISIIGFRFAVAAIGIFIQLFPGGLRLGSDKSFSS